MFLLYLLRRICFIQSINVVNYIDRCLFPFLPSFLSSSILPSPPSPCLRYRHLSYSCSPVYGALTASIDPPSRKSGRGSRGPKPTTHGAHRPGRRSRGGSGRRPWRAHRCRCCGRSTPGGRRPRSAQGGRLGREPGVSLLRENRARRWPLGH